MKKIITLLTIIMICMFSALAQKQTETDNFPDITADKSAPDDQQTLLEPDNKANRSNFAPINLIPAHGSTGLGLRSNLQITYDRDVYAQSSRFIEIYTYSNWEFELHESIPVDSLIIDGAVVTINPTIEFYLSTQYFISLDFGSFTDGMGNHSSGISLWWDPWSFTTTDNDLSADFEADETFGGTPMTVTFTDISNIHTAPITEWTWDFGDGAGSTDQHPVHTYQHTGSDLESYTVTLMVRDANDSVSVRIKENYIQTSKTIAV
jgi:PKD repeat protein